MNGNRRFPASSRWTRAVYTLLDDGVKKEAACIQAYRKEIGRMSAYGHGLQLVLEDAATAAAVENIPLPICGDDKRSTCMVVQKGPCTRLSLAAMQPCRTDGTAIT